MVEWFPEFFEIEALTPHEAFYDVEKHPIEAELKNRLKLQVKLTKEDQ